MNSDERAISAPNSETSSLTSFFKGFVDNFRGAPGSSLIGISVILGFAQFDAEITLANLAIPTALAAE